MNLTNNKQQTIKRKFIWCHFLKRNKKLDQEKNPKQIIKKKPNFLFSKKGQGLIEYLILIALMGVATIGIIRTLNQTVKSRFANAIYALQGRNQKAKTYNMKKKEYQRSDLSNFMSGSTSTDNKTDKRKR